MKLQLVPAKQGLQWVRMGIRTFFRQPLALSGLFFMFLAAASLLSIVPLVGNLIALVLLPGFTAGFMAASREAHQGRFPMPWLLVTAFRQGQLPLRSILGLGALYAVCILAVLGLSALVDGGHFAKMYLLGGELTSDVLRDDSFLAAALMASLLYIPVSLMFWHAPALVLWHRVPAVKSVFFSLMACRRNLGAFVVYGLAWTGVFLVSSMAVAILATLLSDPGLAGAIMLPAALLLAAMFFSSLYFTFVDSFETPPGETP
jgi:hypothetical protein